MRTAFKNPPPLGVGRMSNGFSVAGVVWCVCAVRCANRRRGCRAGRAPYKERTSVSSRREISSGGMLGGNLTGTPMRTVISPR